MKKASLVLATLSALALGSLMSAQPARAEPASAIAVVGVVGWGWCHITYGQPRMTPLCAWHDHWHATWHAQYAPPPGPRR